MSKIKIAIAIPTFDRLNKLKVAVEKIENQVIDDRFELYCVISNIASNDGTSEYLSQLKSGTVKYVIWNKPDVNINNNWRRCAESIPNEIDWVWFHGDDDFITHSTVLQELIDVIIQYSTDKLSLIHACQARRSQNSGNIIRGNLFDLCNQIGYHEMLGWMSSIIIRREKFIPAIIQSTQPYFDEIPIAEFVKHKLSVYRHSASFLEFCAKDDALFIDSSWIEPQDAEQTPESIARWASDNHGERYLFVIDDLLDLYERGVLEKKCSFIFFRYLTYSFWDRYAIYISASVLEAGFLTDSIKEHLIRVRRISELLESDRDVKLFLQWFIGFNNQLIMYERIHREFVETRQKIVDQVNFYNCASYPMEILNQKGLTLS